MKKEFHKGNRERLYAKMKPGSILAIFAGREFRKTMDEYYPFYTNRNFLYLTGIESKDAVLFAAKDHKGSVMECLYLLPPDAHYERWNGERVKPEAARRQSGVEDIRNRDFFLSDIHAAAFGGAYEHLFLDLYKCIPEDQDAESHVFANRVQKMYPHLKIEDVSVSLRELRTIKQPCEIEAIRKAEKTTSEAIIAMMKESKPGMYEYQYKAEFDYVLGQYSPDGPAFPSIISAGANNFCIHYYGYTGQAKDGDMILNDVGAWHDHLMTDVSRGWPCNGKFSDRQRLLYECALKTSNYMFGIIKPGMKMKDVDLTIRKYNFKCLQEAGVLDNYEDIGKYMWHGGAHHVGFDVHDMVEKVDVIAQGMVFCIDVGIYHEAWGIGFRLEDNCLVTEDGCENLSAVTPREIAEIEALIGSNHKELKP